MRAVPRVEYDPSIPKEVLRTIKVALKPTLRFVPRWCASLLVSYSSRPCEKGEDTGATMEAEYRYRAGRLTIYAGWLSNPPNARIELLTHEILHLAIAVVADFAQHELHAMSQENPELQRYLMAECDDRCEATVEDLMEIIRGLV